MNVPIFHGLSGKQARLVAIREATGIQLDPSLSVKQIKRFVTDNLYGRPAWGIYLRTLALLRGLDMPSAA